MSFDYTAARSALADWGKAESDIIEAAERADNAFGALIAAVSEAIKAKESVRAIKAGLGTSQGETQRLMATALVAIKFAPTAAELRAIHGTVRSYVDANSIDKFRLAVSEAKTLKGLTAAIRKPVASGAKSDPVADALLKSAVASALKALGAEAKDLEVVGEHIRDLDRAVAALRAEFFPSSDEDEEEDGGESPAESVTDEVPVSAQQ